MRHNRKRFSVRDLVVRVVDYKSELFLTGLLSAHIIKTDIGELLAPRAVGGISGHTVVTSPLCN